MPAIGITGGISTGKTTVSRFLAEILPDAKIYNADAAARELVDSSAEVRSELKARFGAGIYSASKELNRTELRSIVFSDARQRRALEAILHPRIRQQWSELAQRYRKSPDFFFADIPLLYETAGDTLCDWVVVVAVSTAIQRERLIARSRLEPGRADEMIASQMDLKEKMKRARHVLWNNGDTALLRRQVDALVKLWQGETAIH